MLDLFYWTRKQAPCMQWQYPSPLHVINGVFQGLHATSHIIVHVSLQTQSIS